MLLGNLPYPQCLVGQTSPLGSHYSKCGVWIRSHHLLGVGEKRRIFGQMLNPICFLVGSPSDSCVRSSTPRVMYSGPSFPSQRNNSTFPPPPWPGWKWTFLGLWLWEISGWVSYSFLEVDPILSTQSRPKEVSISPESRTVLCPTPPLKSYKSHLHSLLLVFFLLLKEK